MAEKKEKKVDIPASIKEAVDAVAKGIGVAAVELWSIFVKQYFVKGCTELFTAIVLCIASYFLYPAIGLWILIPLAVALLFCYGAIQLIGNPKYYALEDITGKVKAFTDEKKKSSSDSWRY